MVTTRRAHYLTPNEDKSKPSRHLFFDTETKPYPLDDKKTEQRLYLGWCLFWNRREPTDRDTLHWYYFEAPDTYWDIVEENTYPRNTLYLVAHNINFDLSVLKGFEQLDSRGWTLDSLYTKGMTAIIRFHKAKSKIIVLDNGNWFKTSLRELGKAIGLEKGEVDFENVTKDLLSEYCKNDVEIIYRAWLQWYDFCDTHDLGKWGYTIPSQGFHAYRHRFMFVPLLVHNTPEAINLERASYHGGRTSVFYSGTLTDRTIYKLDINSAYPWGMKGHKQPTELLFYSDRVTLASLSKYMAKNCVIADVKLVTNENPYPVEFEGHNIYPVGTFRTVLSTPELAYALDKGWIREVYQASIYHAEECFNEYVTYFYGLKRDYKQQGNKTFFYMVKLMLNGLYGKFGQTASKFEYYGHVDDIIDGNIDILDTKTGEKIMLYRFGNDLWVERQKGESYNSIPAIASHVTATVRMYLHTLRLSAGLEHVYYCDTDSLFVDKEGYANLQPYLDNNELGKLKLEDTTDSLTLMVPKTYRFGSHWTRKGIPERSIEVAPDTFQFDRFNSIRGMAKSNSKLPYFTEITQRKLNYKLYDGIITPSGWVKPIEDPNPEQVPTYDPEVSLEIFETSELINQLKEARKVPGWLVFKLWDYRKTEWKHAPTATGKMVALEYSKYNEDCRQWGFETLEDLKEEIQIQLDRDKRINELLRSLKSLKAMTK